jgi:protease-4
MLGAAATALWMQPDSSFQAVGMANEDVFLKRAFDKYGVKAEYAQRYEYKNAVNPFLYSDYTAAHRESALGWMGSVYSSAVGAAAADRKLAPEALLTTLAAGPYSAEQAVSLRLIDKVGQVKEAEAALISAAGGGAKLVSLREYRGSLKTPELTGRPTIALVGAEGAIMTGTSDNSNPLSGSQTVYSDDIAKALYEAAEDKDVKAVVFRVSSPGGSDTASEQILAGVRAVKAAGKPVVVSMGTYAASGGYWISSAANEIVADPSTLTGSIGVYGGKFAIGEALSRFGVDMKGLTPTPSARPKPSHRTSASSSRPGWTRSTTASSAGWPRAAACRLSACARSPRAASGPAPRPNSSASSITWAAITSPSTAPRPWPRSTARPRSNASAGRRRRST